jgi:hypothetical protein
MKTGIFAILITTSVALTPTFASAQVCGIGIIAAAMVANFRDNRELTQKEANSCGLLLGQDKQNEKPTKAAKTKKVPKPG